MSIQTGQRFKRLIPNKSRLSASEYNRAMTLLEKISRSTFIDGFAGASGFLTRRTPTPSSSSAAVYARIVQTLQREDVELGYEKINWYEIELLSLKMQDWTPNHGVYYVEDLVKYQSKIYECKIEHNASPSLPPIVMSHWEEASNTRAWVFSYSGDLIEGDHWFQVGDIVEVVRYIDPRWSNREYWILGSVQRIQTGSGENIRCSLYWFQEVDGAIEARLASVYR